MNKKWFIVAAMIIFDGLSVHYPAIFFGASIREPNPVMRYVLHTFGASFVFVLIPLAFLLFWLVIKLSSRIALRYEKRYKTLEEAENSLLNYLIVAYSVIIAGEILMLAGRFFEFPAKILPFYYKNEWLRRISGTNLNYLLVAAVIILAVIIYSIYEKVKWKKLKKK